MIAEADALQQLAAGLGDSFDKAVVCLAKVTGRVIVSGIGKSGHIARKIAATMASTGTPAQFVHPTEGSHGDLGMITAKDAVVMLSNSGNTAELSDTLVYCRRYDIPLIAITQNPQSTLGECADHLLLLPAVEEACSLGMAPTTSTTLQVALGDALAIALLEHRGFTSDDFQRFHPGGALGQQLLRVSDLLITGSNMPLVNEDEMLSQALLVMSDSGKGYVGITDKNARLVGIITDGDLRRAILKHDLLKGCKAKDIMTAKPHTIKKDALAADALGQLNRLSITGLFVVDTEQHPIGFIHVHDLLKAGLR